MKISNSKKELARIISENGGWRDVADWAAQDEVVAFFSGGKPEYATQDKVWCANGDDGYFISAIGADGKIKCFHNTILSREEYFHLYPAQDADGWIEFDGTERPSGYFNEMIDVKLRDGMVLTDSSGRFEWDTDGPSRIIAYRLHKPELAKSTAVGDDETNLAAKDELEAMEYKPTIEQLAADYRNRKGYAHRKQQEADAAKADADAKLAELVAAGKAIGLDVSVADVELELVITDWRDLRKGDEVEYADGGQKDDIGRVGVVDKTERDEFPPIMNVRIIFDDGSSGWPTKWRFIRRT